MRKGRPREELLLSEADKLELEALLRKRNLSQSIALRGKIVLLCAQGMADNGVGKQLGVRHSTVGKWRRRYLQYGIDGLFDAPRPGAPRSIIEEDVALVVKLTLETKPENATHWSTRSMAAKSGMTQTAISRIWRAFGLKPHLVDTFKISTDSFFIEKIKDVVGLYMSPPENAVVFCVDEKSQTQVLDRTQPLLPLRSGQAERRTYSQLT